MKFLDFLEEIGASDVETLRKAYLSYGDSWMKRGGIGAFMMLARKWDRLENQVTKHEITYDVFDAAEKDPRAEGIIDDIRDLRCYLILVEAELLARGHAHPRALKENSK